MAKKGSNLESDDEEFPQLSEKDPNPDRKGEFSLAAVKVFCINSVKTMIEIMVNLVVVSGK